MLILANEGKKKLFGYLPWIMFIFDPALFNLPWLCFWSLHVRFSQGVKRSLRSPLFKYLQGQGATRTFIQTRRLNANLWQRSFFSTERDRLIEVKSSNTFDAHFGVKPLWRWPCFWNWSTQRSNERKMLPIMVAPGSGCNRCLFIYLFSSIFSIILLLPNWFISDTHDICAATLTCSEFNTLRNPRLTGRCTVKIWKREEKRQMRIKKKNKLSHTGFKCANPRVHIYK